MTTTQTLEPLTKYLPIRIDDNMRKKLNQISKETGFAKADLIRHGIKRMFREYDLDGSLIVNDKKIRS